MDNIVYFVFATFEKNEKEIPMGVWCHNLAYVCSQHKNHGHRSDMFYRHYGKIVSLRVVERIRQEPQPGSPALIISENCYTQRDMRRIARSVM